MDTDRKACDVLIVDTSALVAVVFEEPEADQLIHRLAVSPSTGIGTPTLAELGLVLSSRLGMDAGDVITPMLEEFHIAEVSFGEEHWREAVSAHRRFGRGNHEAKLNFGDCLSYAVARLANEPLLFIGNDFAATDIEAA